MSDRDDEEWQRLLRGSFAFENSDFACHPSDSAFAEELYYRCVAENITLEAVLTAASAYLHYRGGHPNSISEQLEAIKNFWRKHAQRSPKKKVWVVYWDNSNESRPVEERVISIFSVRKSSRDVSFFMEEYYKACCYTVQAKLVFATISSKVDLYRPNKTGLSERYIGFKLECGDNPKIRARVVEDFKLTVRDGKTAITWTELKIPPEIEAMRAKKKDGR